MDDITNRLKKDAAKWKEYFGKEAIIEALGETPPSIDKAFNEIFAACAPKPFEEEETKND